MTPRAYYNEIDPFAAHWLYNLIQRNLIAPGDIDTRDIRDVRPIDLKPYTQCHFFAGIGVWSHALRRAGWSDRREVWTGSCPCQPFSAAGKGGGFADERHLWPHFHYLIEQCRPDVVLGEQVASKDGLGWFDLVQSDLEGSGYAAGAIDSCSAGFGAPHIRQRLYWMAYAGRASDECVCGPGEAPGAIGAAEGEAQQRQRSGAAVGTGVSSSGLAFADHSLGRANAAGRNECDGAHAGRSQSTSDAQGRGCAGELAHPDLQIQGGRRIQRPGEGNDACIGPARERSQGLRATGGMADAATSGQGEERQDVGRQPCGDEPQRLAAGLGAGSGDLRPGPTNGFWSSCDWLLCRDGKWRPVEPGTFPLAHGAPARVGRLRAYGNAINAEQATAFCEIAKEFLQ